jgi:hypothetical protein
MIVASKKKERSMAQKTKVLVFILLALLLTAVPVFSQDFYRSMTPGEIKKVNVIIKQDELRQDGDFYIWEPNRSVRRSVYETYYLSFIDPDSILGDYGKEAKVSMYITMLKPETYVPNDPNMQRPQGGFTIHRYMASILSMQSNSNSKR